MYHLRMQVHSTGRVVWGSLAAILGSNSSGDIDVFLLCSLYAVCGGPITHPGKVLSSVCVCVCVCVCDEVQQWPSTRKTE
jgi:hypothetical protein